MNITDADREQIRKAIVDAEKNTSGEIVAIVAGQSDDYQHIPLLWAATVAFVVPAPLILQTDLSAVSIYMAQLVVFAVLALGFNINPVRMALVPRRLKKLRAHRRAVDQFLAQNLHTTEGRTGIMIFVSAAEHYVEIIADEGIYDKIDHAVWAQTVDRLAKKIGGGQVAGGFVDAIAEAGELLSAHFPPRPANADELPNRLIVL